MIQIHTFEAVCESFLTESLHGFIALRITLILYLLGPNYPTFSTYTSVSLRKPRGNRYFTALEAKMVQKSNYHESSRTHCGSDY